MPLLVPSALRGRTANAASWNSGLMSSASWVGSNYRSRGARDGTAGARKFQRWRVQLLSSAGARVVASGKLLELEPLMGTVLSGGGGVAARTNRGVRDDNARAARAQGREFCCYSSSRLESRVGRTCSMRVEEHARNRAEERR
ncbi:hypothetical protein CDL15_Pgr004312 [Punica granatum]|uniref:Uncharacterized protein n=1 Tax=Punica granatum TaxID=22663 RepID=A0A218XHD7_PUNGR|nr:hypothetical protein CDL15_Pgr004312 [Punica granatum]